MKATVLSVITSPLGREQSILWWAICLPVCLSVY